jgi:hypothetical protein
MNKFLSLLLVVVAIAQATAFMGTPVVTHRQVRMLLILRFENSFGIHRERLLWMNALFLRHVVQ